MNKVILIGNLTRDPELNFIAGNGTAITKFTVAVQRFKKEETDFINCVVFGKIAENVAQFTQKGSKVCVEGSIKIGSFTDKDGNKRNSTEIVGNSVEFLSKSSVKNEEIIESNNVINDINSPDFPADMMPSEDGDYPF